mgnify:CR=1 FL=1
MWSRRHFADARPAGIVFLQNLIAGQKASTSVVDNLAAIAVPMRRLARAKAPNPAH